MRLDAKCTTPSQCSQEVCKGVHAFARTSELQIGPKLALIAERNIMAPLRAKIAEVQRVKERLGRAAKRKALTSVREFALCEVSGSEMCCSPIQYVAHAGRIKKFLRRLLRAGCLITAITLGEARQQHLLRPSWHVENICGVQTEILRC